MKCLEFEPWMHEDGEAGSFGKNEVTYNDRDDNIKDVYDAENNWVVMLILVTDDTVTPRRRPHLNSH